MLPRLPELDLIAFGVGDPSETAVVVVFALGVDLHPFGAQKLDQCVEILDAIVDHERGFAWIEVLGSLGKDGPDRPALLFGILGVSPGEHDARARHALLDAEMSL